MIVPGGVENEEELGAVVPVKRVLNKADTTRKRGTRDTRREPQ